jgi:beta-phosphoglucomutase
MDLCCYAFDFMHWIHDFQLFLFDFDGLLVNTEHIHYQAYVDVLAREGHALKLSFGDFFKLAHLNSNAWKEALYADIPTLSPAWEKLYEQKKRVYLELLLKEPIVLMPGVEKLLIALKEANIRRCVVTHSGLKAVQRIQSKIPLLSTLPHWITREDYDQPKPDPECYLKAIRQYGKPNDRIIGFEDSLRGLRALKQTSATSVLICPKLHPLYEIGKEEGIHFESFQSITVINDFD